MHRPAASIHSVIPGGNPHYDKQKGTYPQNTPPYYCYDSIYITYSETTTHARIGGI